MNWKKEYQKEDGIEVGLFVDLMIANKGDKKMLNKQPKLDYSFYVDWGNRALKKWYKRKFCPLCGKEFKTWKGIAIHFGKVHKHYKYL